MKHWIFDLDGTLVDSFSYFFSALTDIFSDYGSKFPDNLREPALTEPLPEFFMRHLGPGSVPNALHKLQKRSNDDALRIQPFEGIGDVLAYLHRHGCKIAIWTSRDLISADLILSQTGLARYVEQCVSGSCTSQRKPHPEGIYRIAKTFNCTPAQITMVGDHEHDVMAAKTAGARAIRASWHGYWQVPASSLCDLHFHKLSDFHHWLKTSGEF